MAAGAFSATPEVRCRAHCSNTCPHLPRLEPVLCASDAVSASIRGHRDLYARRRARRRPRHDRPRPRRRCCCRCCRCRRRCCRLGPRKRRHGALPSPARPRVTVAWRAAWVWVVVRVAGGSGGSRSAPRRVGPGQGVTHGHVRAGESAGHVRVPFLLSVICQLPQLRNIRTLSRSYLPVSL